MTRGACALGVMHSTAQVPLQDERPQSLSSGNGHQLQWEPSCSRSHPFAGSLHPRCRHIQAPPLLLREPRLKAILAPASLWGWLRPCACTTAQLLPLPDPTSFPFFRRDPTQGPPKRTQPITSESASRGSTTFGTRSPWEAEKK